MKNTKTKTYKLGDFWSNDFDYVGMLNTGLNAEISKRIPLSSLHDLNELFESFQDVNYHKQGGELWKCIVSLKGGDYPNATKHLRVFQTLCQIELNLINDYDTKNNSNVRTN